MYSDINIGSLTDKQKALLSQLSYLDVNDEGRKKLKNGVLTVYELKEYLDASSSPFCGNAWLGDDTFNKVVNKVVGNIKIPSNSELLEELIDRGLGDLRIKSLSDVQTITSSGFQAIVFEDSHNNVGISFRGTDFDFSHGGIRDVVEADVLEYFTDMSTQIKQALEYFEKNRSINGNNYIYGHSMGGNLVSHTYLKNYNNIREAFTINGYPINQKLLDAPEKIAAFNDSQKYNCNVICGDVVSFLKDNELYRNNVHFVKNISSVDGMFAAHLVQSADYNEDGGFILASLEEAIKRMRNEEKTFARYAQSTRENINKLQEKSVSFSERIKKNKT